MLLEERIDGHEARISSLERRDELRADEMVAISALSDELRREKDERDDASAKMIASIKLMFDARQTPQDAQLAMLTARAEAAAQAQRIQVFAALPGVIVMLLGMWQKVPIEGSLALAGAVWLAMRQALGAPKIPGGPPGSSLPPGKP